MGAHQGKKRNKQASGNPGLPAGSGKLLRGVASPYAAAFLTILVAFGATALAWQRWGSAAISAADHKLTLDSLQVSPQPDWILVDVKSEVFRDGSLAELNFLDPQLSLKVSRAFEMHAWVAKVDRTGKRPSGRVIVDLHYRRPVAWVKIPKDGARIQQDSVLPIDADAVVLDPAELKLQPDDLLKISISELPQYGPKGTAWSDTRLMGAAKLASLLKNCWQECGVYQIRGLSHLDSNRPASVYELVTHSGPRIVWGVAPGLEQSNEPKAVDKLSRLKSLAARGGLSGRETLQLDLRVPQAGPPEQRRDQTPADSF